MTTKTITITDPKDYQPGDRFRGTSNNYKGSGVSITVDGVLIGSRFVREPSYTDLYVKGAGNLPYVHLQKADNLIKEGYWTDVTVTREVEVPELPTEPGIYRGAKWTEDVPALCFTLNHEGNWFIHWSDGSTDKHVPLSSDLPLVRMVREDGE